MAIDVSRLTEQQQLALQQYTAVTDQAVDAAVPLLQRSQWNVQIAIAKFFDGEDQDVAEALAAGDARAGDIPLPRRQPQQETLAHSLQRRSHTSRLPDLAPRVVPQPGDAAYRLPAVILFILAPLRYLFRAVYYLTSFLPIPRLLSGFFARSDTYRKQLKPRDCAIRVQRELEEEFGVSPLPLNLVESSYAAALDLAKQEFKYLIVVLLSTEHDSHSSFVRNTILSSAVADFIRSRQEHVIAWVGDVRDTEAYSVSAALRCTAFPFTAIIAHTKTRAGTSGGMSVLARMTGDLSAEVWAGKARAAMEQHDQDLDEQRRELQTRNLERRLREDQDSAYERSLAVDRERARKRREEEDRLKQAAELHERKAAAEAERQRLERQWRRWRASRIVAEPDSEAADIVRIRITLPEHGRIMRRFRADLPVEELYAFADCYDQMDGQQQQQQQQHRDQGVLSKPPGYTHQYGFRLVSTMPRVVYECIDGVTIGNSIGKNGNLIVEPLGDE